VDAATLNGQAVYFQILEPWKLQADEQHIDPLSDFAGQARS